VADEEDDDEELKPRCCGTVVNTKASTNMNFYLAPVAGRSNFYTFTYLDQLLLNANTIILKLRMRELCFANKINVNIYTIRPQSIVEIQSFGNTSRYSRFMK
jgi:hypothetical protein